MGSQLKTMMEPNAAYGIGKQFEAVVARASSPENVFIDVVPDNCMKESGLLEADGIVIDRGQNKPHSGGYNYLIEFVDGSGRIKTVMKRLDGTYSIGNDWGVEVVNGDDFVVIGRVIGTVQVRQL